MVFSIDRKTHIFYFFQPSFGLPEPDLEFLHERGQTHGISYVPIIMQRAIAHFSDGSNKLTTLHYSIGSRRAAAADCLPCASEYYHVGNDQLNPDGPTGPNADKMASFWRNTYDTLVELVKRKFPDVSKRPPIARPFLGSKDAKASSSCPTGHLVNVRPAMPAPATYGPACPIATHRFVTGIEFPEYRRRVEKIEQPELNRKLPVLRVVSQIPQSPGLLSTKTPIIRGSSGNLDDGRVIGYRKGDLFFGNPLIAERCYLNNHLEAAKIAGWVPGGTRFLKVVIVHDSTFLRTRLTSSKNVHVYAGPQGGAVGATFAHENVMEKFLDPSSFEVHQVVFNEDLSDSLSTLRLAQFIGQIPGLGKTFHLFVQNNYHSLFHANDGLEKGNGIHCPISREMVSCALGSSLVQLRYQLKAPLAFIGFGVGIQDDSAGNLRVGVIDGLRQRNPTFMADYPVPFYITDVTSCSKGVANTERVRSDWRRNRIEFLLKHFILGFSEECLTPYHAV
jgi:hypothetical protein